MLLLWIIYVISVLLLLYFLACLFLYALWSPAGKGLASWLSFVIYIFTDRSKTVLLLWIIYVISVLVLLYFHVCLFIYALWSPAGKGLASWLSFVVSTVSVSLSHWYLGSGMVLDCIDS